MFSKNFSNKILFDYIQGFDNAQCLYSQSIVDTFYGWFKKECHGKNQRMLFFKSISLQKNQQIQKHNINSMYWPPRESFEKGTNLRTNHSKSVSFLNLSSFIFQFQKKKAKHRVKFFLVPEKILYILLEPFSVNTQI